VTGAFFRCDAQAARVRAEPFAPLFARRRLGSPSKARRPWKTLEYKQQKLDPGVVLLGADNRILAMNQQTV
jgi:hypothetical protein